MCFTHLVAHADLEYRAVLLCPSLCYLCVVCAELIQAAKDRQAGHFWKTFDVRCVGPVHEPVHDDTHDNSAGDVDWNRHDAGCSDR